MVLIPGISNFKCQLFSYHSLWTEKTQFVLTSHTCSDWEKLFNHLWTQKTLYHNFERKCKSFLARVRVSFRFCVIFIKDLHHLQLVHNYLDRN